MVSELGRKMMVFVANKRLRKRLPLPFQPVIIADHQFAIFDNMDDYKYSYSQLVHVHVLCHTSSTLH